MGLSIKFSKDVHLFSMDEYALLQVYRKYEATGVDPTIKEIENPLVKKQKHTHTKKQ